MKEILTSFEKEKEYAIDRKTLNCIIDDISDIKLIKKVTYEINYHYQNSVFNERSYKAVFLIYHNVEVSDEELKN